MICCVYNTCATIHSYIDQSKLDSFNAAVTGVTDWISRQCGSYNCLNATLTPPSQRNAAAKGNNCAAATQDVTYVCANAPKWNATHPTYCGATQLGECDGGTCYNVVCRALITYILVLVCAPNYIIKQTQYDFEDAIQDYRNMVSDFLNNPSINDFHALDPYVFPGFSGIFQTTLCNLLQDSGTQRCQRLRQGCCCVHSLATAARPAWYGDMPAYSTHTHSFAGSDQGELDNIQIFAQQASSWLNSRISFYTKYGYIECL